ncbi:hypothetical protein DW075_20375, partial [Bacteroides xylanisolvens]
MCKDNDFSPQITRINTDYFIEKWSQNETGTFRNKKTGKKKVFYPNISWLENSQFDNDFSPQITRINTDYFIEKWSQNETGTFRNKKTGKK